MKSFSLRALGAAARQLRADASTSDYANDLVQRTLAQHGLAFKPGVSGLADNPADSRPSAKKRTSRPRSDVPLPEGATFEADLFVCPQGERRFLTYVPATATLGLRGLVLMLHGCTQSPEDFAAGTRMNDLAETHRLVVIYPHQSRGQNAQSCWNWFRRGDQRRDHGEPAILSCLAKCVAAEHGVPTDAIFAAGLSAGGAMAAILGEAYPEVFAAIGVHSGLPVASAKDVPSAFAAMAGRPLQRTVQSKGRVSRTIVLHGTDDGTVHPSNGHEIVRQVLQAGPQLTLQTQERGQVKGRTYLRTVTTEPAGAVLAEHWEIDSLSHAWSGGSAVGSYSDPAGPDASAEMIRFFLK